MLYLFAIIWRKTRCDPKRSWSLSSAQHAVPVNDSILSKTPSPSWKSIAVVSIHALSVFLTSSATPWKRCMKFCVWNLVNSPDTKCLNSSNRKKILVFLSVVLGELFQPFTISNSFLSYPRRWQWCWWHNFDVGEMIGMLVPDAYVKR